MYKGLLIMNHMSIMIVMQIKKDIFPDNPMQVIMIITPDN